MAAHEARVAAEGRALEATRREAQLVEAMELLRDQLGASRARSALPEDQRLQRALHHIATPRLVTATSPAAKERRALGDDEGGDGEGATVDGDVEGTTVSQTGLARTDVATWAAGVAAELQQAEDRAAALESSMQQVLAREKRAALTLSSSGLGRGGPGRGDLARGSGTVSEELSPHGSLAKAGGALDASPHGSLSKGILAKGGLSLDAVTPDDSCAVAAGQAHASPPNTPLEQVRFRPLLSPHSRADEAPDDLLPASATELSPTQSLGGTWRRRCDPASLSPPVTPAISRTTRRPHSNGSPAEAWATGESEEEAPSPPVGTGLALPGCSPTYFREHSAGTLAHEASPSAVAPVWLAEGLKPFEGALGASDGAGAEREAGDPPPSLEERLVRLRALLYAHETACLESASLMSRPEPGWPLVVI